MRDTPNWREIYRYLGYRNGARPEGEALRLIERAEAGVRKAAEPRCVCRRLGLSFPAENTLDIGGILIKRRAPPESRRMRGRLPVCGHARRGRGQAHIRAYRPGPRERGRRRAGRRRGAH
ncbi:MAG: hypothetical protein ACLTSG_05350 [Lachnospiraceae bacterium]